MDKKIIAHYPSSRRLSSEEKKGIAEVLSLHPNHKHLKAMIRKNYGKLVTLKDIQNLKGGVKSSHIKVLKMHCSFWTISKRHCRKTIPHVVVLLWMKSILLRFSIFRWDM